MKTTTLFITALLSGSVLITSCGEVANGVKTTESKSEIVSISIVNNEKKVDISTTVNGKVEKRTLTGEEAEAYIKENGNGMHYSDDGSELDIDITTSALESPEVKAKLDELIAVIEKESKIEGKSKVSIKINTDKNFDIDDINIDKLMEHDEGETKTIIKEVIIENDNK